MIAEAKALLDNARRAVVFTGAGISAARAEHGVTVTQNVDDLHERAGATDVIHLHGSLFAARCSACDAPAGDATCELCGAPARPGVVWFGEALPTTELEAAIEAAANADVLLQVNPEATPLDPLATINLHGSAARVLPELVGEA